MTVYHSGLTCAQTYASTHAVQTNAIDPSSPSPPPPPAPAPGALPTRDWRATGIVVCPKSHPGQPPPPSLLSHFSPTAGGCAGAIGPHILEGSPQPTPLRTCTRQGRAVGQVRASPSSPWLVLRSAVHCAARRCH